MSQFSTQGGASAYDTTDELPWNPPPEGASYNYWPAPRKRPPMESKQCMANKGPSYAQSDESAIEDHEKSQENYINDAHASFNDDGVGVSYVDSGHCSEHETFPDTENGTPVATFQQLPPEGLPPPRLPLPPSAAYIPMMHPPPGLMQTPMANTVFYPGAQFAAQHQQQFAQPPVYWFHQQPPPQFCRMMPPAQTYQEGGNVPAGERSGEGGELRSEGGAEPDEEGRRDKMCDEIFTAVETALQQEKRRIRAKYLKGENISQAIEQSAQTSEPDSTSTAAQTLSQAMARLTAESQTILVTLSSTTAQTEPRPAAAVSEAGVQVNEKEEEKQEEEGVCTAEEYKELQLRSETQLMELKAKNIKLGELNRAKSALELKVRQLESERDQLQATRKDLSNQLKSADKKMKAANNSNKELHEAQEKTARENAVLVKALKAEIGSLEERVKDLTEKLRDKTEEYQTAQRVVDIFKVEVRKWKTEARRVQQRQVQLASCSRCIEFTKLESAYGSLQKELRLEQDRCAAASRAREELKERFRDYVSPDREGQLLREIDNLTAMHEVDQRSLRKEISQLKEERDRFKIQHAEESHRSSKLLSELKDIRGGQIPVVDNGDSWLVEQLDSAAQQYSTQVSELRGQISKLKSELELIKIQSRQESDNARMFRALLQDAESEKERYRLKLIETEDALRRMRRDSSGYQRRLGETPPTSIGHVAATNGTPGRSKSQFHCGKEELQDAIGSYPRRSPTEAKSSRASSSDEDEEGALRDSRAVLRR